MCAAGGFEDVSRLYETADGRTLVLPLLRRSMAGGLLAFDRANQPHCGVSGIIAAGGASAGEIGAVLDDLARRRVLAQSVSPGAPGPGAVRGRPRACVHGRPVAGSVVIVGANAYDLRGAMDETMVKTKANDLLQSRSIEDACNAGCRNYYLGDSGWPVTAGAFKERWGALHTATRSTASNGCPSPVPSS
jgi:hypothetical protein